MINRIIQAIFGPRLSAEEKYFSEAEDHYDLERRYRDLERRQFGGTHRRMHNNFYI